MFVVSCFFLFALQNWQIYICSLLIKGRDMAFEGTSVGYIYLMFLVLGSMEAFVNEGNKHLDSKFIFE
jgi:hypothetical protein